MFGAEVPKSTERLRVAKMAAQSQLVDAVTRKADARDAAARAAQVSYQVHGFAILTIASRLPPVVDELQALDSSLNACPGPQPTGHATRLRHPAWIKSDHMRGQEANMGMREIHSIQCFRPDFYVFAPHRPMTTRRLRMTGRPILEFLLFWGTVLSAVASANGCINDAARAWFSLGRDRYLPTWFSAVHPKYRTPYRSIVFLLPIALAFAFIADLNQAITFSILSGVLQYTFMSINIMMFRNKWPLGSIRLGYTHPFHPIPAVVLLVLCVVTYFAIFLGFGSQLTAMVVFYLVVSLWFHFYRYQYVRRGDQFTMPWPKPLGY